MSNELNEVQGVLTEFSRVAAGLNALREKHANTVYEVSTTAGLDAAKAARAEVREPRYAVESVRKAAKAPLVSLGKRIDAEAARITAEIMAIEQPIDDQIRAEEARRVAEREAKKAAEVERVRQEAAAKLKEEEDRLAAERAALAAERAALEAEAAAAKKKADAEAQAERARLAAEREALRVEQEKAAAIVRAEAAAAKKKADAERVEQEKAEAERKAVAEAQAREFEASLPPLDEVVGLIAAQYGVDRNTAKAWMLHYARSLK